MNPALVQLKPNFHVLHLNGRRASQAAHSRFVFRWGGNQQGFAKGHFDEHVCVAQGSEFPLDASRQKIEVRARANNDHLCAKQAFHVLSGFT